MSVKRGRRHGLRARNLAPYHLGPIGPAMLLSRKVVTRRTKRVVGYFLSLKMKCALPWESQIERDYFYCLELDQEVQAYHAQPTCLTLLVGGEIRRHFPDLLVQYRNGQIEYQEVKTDRDAAAPEKQALFNAARLEFAKASAGYQVVTEAQIRRQPRLSNCQNLIHHRRRQVSFDDTLRVLSALAAGPIKYKDLQLLLAKNSHPEADLLALTAVGKIRFCLESELNAETAFQLGIDP
jgi:hypothetical protein